MDATVLGFRALESAIADIFASGAARAGLVDGPPGVGKTSLGPYIQQAMGLANRFIIKPGHHDPIDFQGLPVPDHTSKRSYFYPSGTLLPHSDLQGGCLMIWDEAGDSPQAVQNLLCQAIFENGLHGYVFPKHTYHLLTANRVSDKAGSQRIVTKLGNRVAWFTLEPTVDDLFHYGVNNGWDPAVLAFLKLKGMDYINPNDRSTNGRRIPTFFNSFDPDDKAQLAKPIFATSRSWEAASKLSLYATSKNMGDGVLLPRAASLISTPVASAFVPFRSEAKHMPDPQDILDGKKVPIPTAASTRCALAVSLVSRVQKKSWKNMDAWLKQKGVGLEFRVLAVRMAFDTRAPQLACDDFNATLQDPDIQEALTAR